MKQFFTAVNKDDLIIFMYTNWKGTISKRKALFQGFFFGKTEYHPDYQLFINGFDLDKLEHRTYAVKNISAIEVINVSK